MQATQPWHLPTLWFYLKTTPTQIKIRFVYLFIFKCIFLVFLLIMPLNTSSLSEKYLDPWCKAHANETTGILKVIHQLTIIPNDYFLCKNLFWQKQNYISHWDCNHFGSSYINERGKPFLTFQNKVNAVETPPKQHSP